MEIIKAVLYTTSQAERSIRIQIKFSSLENESF